jgi:hypothetical protein
MNNAYSIRTLPGTSSTAVILTGLLLGCAGGIFLPTEAQASSRFNQYEVRDLAATSSAAMPFYFIDSKTSANSSIDVESSVTSFYSKLQSTQESLGEAFEQVLVENLWDLYSRT